MLNYHLRYATLQVMRKTLLFTLFVVILASAGLYWWQQRDDDALQTDTEVVATKYQNITFDVESGWNDEQRFYVVYPITENESINEQVRTVIDEKLSSFESRVTSFTDTVPDLNLSTDVNFATEEVVLFEIFTTDNTAQIPEETVDTLFFDRGTGEQYTLANFFDSDDYLQRLSDLSRAALPSIVENPNTKLINQGTEPTEDNFDEFGITSETEMFINFEPGQVADESQGIISMPFQIADIEDILSADFEDKLFPGYLAEQERKQAEAEAAAQAKAEREALAAQSAATVAVANPQSTGAVDCTANKFVALSFDDGPNGSTTPQLLNILDQYNVKATFFLIGRQVAPNAAIVQRMVDSGHIIGNHTWDHKDLTSLSAAEAKSEVDRTQDAIANASGVTPYFVRPPYGAINDSTRAAIGFPTIEWSVDPEDWKNKDANIVFNRVITNTQAGSIVLSHDIYQSTVDAYARIVPQLLNDGFTLVTIPQLLDFTPETIGIRNYF